MTPLLLIAIALNAPAVHAESSTETRNFRSYLLEIRAMSGELKNSELQVNPDLKTSRIGDPEIPGHGHYNYSVTGTVVESGRSCRFELLLSQGKGAEQNNRQILDSGIDRGGELSLCSGLKLDLGSVRGLLTADTLPLVVRTQGLSQPIGKGTATFQGLRTLEEDGCADPWHCPPHYIGPRH